MDMFSIVPKTKAYKAMKFMRNVVANYPGDECLVWPFDRDRKTGYGVITVEGKTKIASRMVCEIVNGPPPSRHHHAAHSCGNGPGGCCSPNHLRWATPTENQHDRIAHGTHNRGERHGKSKLTKSQVLEIRASSSDVPTKEAASMYGVSDATIIQIRNKTVWKWLD